MSWNHEYFESLAKLREARIMNTLGLHVTLQETWRIHDSMNIPKIDFIS